VRGPSKPLRTGSCFFTWLSFRKTDFLGKGYKKIGREKTFKNKQVFHSEQTEVDLTFCPFFKVVRKAS
jgi:hypothetical protein